MLLPALTSEGNDKPGIILWPASSTLRWHLLAIVWLSCAEMEQAAWNDRVNDQVCANQEVASQAQEVCGERAGKYSLGELWDGIIGLLGYGYAAAGNVPPSSGGHTGTSLA